MTQYTDEVKRIKELAGIQDKKAPYQVRSIEKDLSDRESDIQGVDTFSEFKAAMDMLDAKFSKVKSFEKQKIYRDLANKYSKSGSAIKK